MNLRIGEKAENRLAVGEEMFIGLEGGELAASVERQRQQELIREVMRDGGLRCEKLFHLMRTAFCQRFRFDANPSSRTGQPFALFSALKSHQTLYFPWGVSQKCL